MDAEKPRQSPPKGEKQAQEPRRNPARPGAGVPLEPALLVPGGGIVPPKKPDEPKPSGIQAFWLAVALLNVLLFVFLIPESWLENTRLSFVIKAGSVLAATGAFVAGIKWYKQIIAGVSRRTWFKIANTAVLSVLLTLHLSQQPIVPIYPRVEPDGARLELDGRQREYRGRSVWVPIKDQPVKVGPEDRPPTEYKLSYKDIFFGIFNKYSPRWPMRYPLAVGFNQPEVNVSIRKIDGEFDSNFIADPPQTNLKINLEIPQGEKSLVNYRSAKSSFSGDEIELPLGRYELTARRAGCQDPEVQTVELGEGLGPEPVFFKMLCTAGR